MKHNELSGESQTTPRPQRKGEKETPSDIRAHRTPEQWSDLISQRIEEAMREGKFDNLRSKGRPLNPAPEPYVPPDMQMANSLLKNNDLAPAWISDRAQILGEIERFRRKLRTALAEHNDALAAAKTAADQARIEHRWQTQLDAWQEEIRTLNRRIELQNFKQPVSFLEIVKLRFEDEIKRLRD
ncbi:MAG: hypothetical protein BroJett021_50710 [Chloroflexota bacterium]|nr:DUF1992 domain-containing protein [Caldilinea sp.]GIK76083.1 MAG: hypothetical protein BroJett021_50710 [Chloroflexota bacterium]